MRGRLDVVATPIGNLGDASPRTIDALRDADVIAAEDSRRTGSLLAKLGIERDGTRLVPLHKFNEARRLERLIGELEGGARIALVTDGGTPGISDPGSRLVAEAHRRGIAVRVIPGPSAVVAALSVSGLEADHFHFAGFLPSRQAARRRALAELASVSTSLVFYEAPHRIVAMLGDAHEELGERDAVLCRELTKLHEEVVRAPLSALAAMLAQRGEILGEIVLVVGPPASSPRDADADAGLAKELEAALSAEDGDLKRAIKRLSRDRGWPRAETKRRLLRSL